MKVYVVTRAEFFKPEIYVTVKASRKEAEKVIRKDYPNARRDEDSYLCKDRAGHESLMFIHEETV